jgi:BASS family bile acid:Na+ symporter
MEAAMNARNEPIPPVASFLDHNFLWLLLGCYAAAAVTPDLGLWIRNVSFGEVHLFQQKTRVTLPMLMLALLLLNAGLAVKSSRLMHLPRFSLILVVGLAVNLLVPVVFTFAATPLIGRWLDADEVQSILLGLALIASMPIAGSSTAWSQNTGGNMVVSLGLVILSTLLSPLTTPVVLRALGVLATGDQAEDLRDLAAHGTGIFLVICVVGPSLLGMLLGRAIGEARLAMAKSHLKVLNWVNLLLLIYANASMSLPEAVAYPDIDFLLTSLGIAIVLCVLAFASGWAVGRLLGTDRPQQASLMFGLGMNNNGTGLVLAATALADHPRVMLPIIVYNLIQHLVAGSVAFLLSRKGTGQDTPGVDTDAGPDASYQIAS